MTISDHATSFANRNVETFDPEVGISDPVGTAYLLRVEWDEINVDITKNLELLLQDPQANQLRSTGDWTVDSTDVRVQFQYCRQRSRRG